MMSVAPVLARAAAAVAALLCLLQAADAAHAGCQHGLWGPFCKNSDGCYYHNQTWWYQGGQGVTVSGRKCQSWRSQKPHPHPYQLAGLFADQAVPGAVCRDIIGDGFRPWCYTTDPDVEWEYCAVKNCGDCPEDTWGEGCQHMNKTQTSTISKPTKAPEPQCAPMYKRLKGHTACLPRSKDARTVVMTDRLRHQIVIVHNMLRAGVRPYASDMLKMSWDSELEMLAKRWVEGCDFRKAGHDAYLGRVIPGRYGVGQNMHYGSVNFGTAITAWWNEYKNYKIGQDYQTQWWKNRKVIAHYTQMAWAKTYQVGCAAAVCGSGAKAEKVIACNYGPAGNVLPFSAPYKYSKTTPKKAAACPKNAHDGLCDCGTATCNQGRLDPATCQCDCRLHDGSTPAFRNNKDCHLDCRDVRDPWWCGSSASRCRNTQVLLECPKLCGVCPLAGK